MKIFYLKQGIQLRSIFNHGEKGDWLYITNNSNLNEEKKVDLRTVKDTQFP